MSNNEQVKAANSSLFRVIGDEGLEPPIVQSSIVHSPALISSNNIDTAFCLEPPRAESTGVDPNNDVFSQGVTEPPQQEGASNGPIGDAFNTFWVNANARVRASKQINAGGCKIPVPTFWNIQLFEELLRGYHDQEIIKFMRYGWPIDCGEVAELHVTPPNQQGARDNPTKLGQYIDAELDRKSVIGPFEANPFDASARISPLDAIPKKESDDLRIILNLSYPPHKSVNDAIDKDWFLGEATNLKYPGVDSLIRLIKRKGRGCLLFKTDLKKFYRQIFMDPGSIHLLGYSIQGKLYFDVVLSMGLRIACYIGQRITNALMYIYKRLSFEGINYLDDLGGAERKNRARRAYSALKGLLKDLNMWEAEEKACPPAHIMTFLGIEYNTINLTIALTKDRLTELKNLVSEWLRKEAAEIKQVQSLLGKLNFACATVRAGRVFLARIIAFLCQFYIEDKQVLPIPSHIKKDLEWWAKFIQEFDGISIMHDDRFSRPDAKINSDSCLSGCGAWNESGEYFHLQYPAQLVTDADIHISELECLAVTVALKVWVHRYKGKNLLLHCDNSSTVEVINKGKAKHPFTQCCLREIVWLCAINQVWIKMAFLPGVSNRFADLLSRWHLNPSFGRTFHAKTRGWRKWKLKLETSIFEFSHKW